MDGGEGSWDHLAGEKLTQTRAKALGVMTYPCMSRPAKTMMMKAKKTVKPRTTVHQTGVLTMYGPPSIEVNAACVGTCDMVPVVEILRRYGVVGLPTGYGK